MEAIPGHIEAPETIELKCSKVDPSRFGAFSLLTIPKDSEFGPYHGKIVYYKNDETVDPKYSWEVFDLETFKFLHIVDATDPADGNWMRYVCCARFFEEQNIVSTQNGQDVFYKALKDIEPGEELLTWFQPKKKKRKRSSILLEKDPLEPETFNDSEDRGDIPSPASPEKGKRKRKPKIIPDSYHGPLEVYSKKSKQAYDDMFEPLQPGQKRRRRKKISTDSRSSSSSTLDTVAPDNTVFVEQTKAENNDTEDIDNADSNSVQSVSVTASKDGKRENGQLTGMSISEINNSVEWVFPAKGQEYLFELKEHHVTVRNGKKVYQCDICLGLYKHMFSLKRHYLRNHVNYKYLSKADMTNCLINLAQVIQNMKERGLEICKNLTKPGDDCCDDAEVKKEADNDESTDTTTNTNVVEETKDCNTETVRETSGKEDSQCTENDKQDKSDSSAISQSTENDNDKVKQDKSDSSANSQCTENAIDKVKQDKSDSRTSSQSTENAIDKVKQDKSDSSASSQSTENDADKVKQDKSDISANTSDKHINGKNSPENLDKCQELDKELVSEETSMESMNKVDENLLEDRDQRKDSTEENSEKDGHTVETSKVLKEIKNYVQSLNDPALFYCKVWKKSGLFRCYTCYDVFDTVEEVREHVQNHPKQEEGTCFPCDLCNMRFNYKQNLVRHRKVHEDEEQGDKPFKMQHSRSDDDISLAGSESNGSPGKMTNLQSEATINPKPVETYQVFKCSKCKTNFESLEAMKSHVQAEHISGNKFQCQYCGKDFPSMPNMKKHVRFHLGYRVSCRACTEVFPNVGALRKHTRLAHLELYKARQSLKGDSQAAQNKKINSETVVNKECDQNSATKEETVKDSVDNTKKEKSENFPYDHEISFAADEIDDGGSRFKFSCTVCKKRFSNYINMCRHRRKSHSNDSKPRHEELSLSFCHKAKNDIPTVQEDPVEVAQFYANVSHNIATNLNCFIDGHQQSLEKFVDHIKIEDYSGDFGYNPVEKGPQDFTWEKYNFPPNYKPSATISYEEIRKTVGIPDKLNLSETDNNKAVTEVGNTETVNNCVEDTTPASDSENSVAMGKHPVGFKSLDTLTDTQKEKTSDCKMNSFTKVKIAGGVIEMASPVSKNFRQMMKGEYASFDDDLLPSDINSLEEPRFNSRSIKEARLGLGHRPRAISDTSKDRRKPGQASAGQQKLIQAAQDELEELYDSIETHEYDNIVKQVPATTPTPEALSMLCEKILGIRRTGKTESRDTTAVLVNDDSEECSNESLLMSELNLASQRAAKLTNGRKSVVPDYSDVPDGSPFYNYESIAFGNSGDVVSVCAICRRHFKDIEGVLRHHWKKHPGSIFQILEVEQGHEIDKLHFCEPSYVGALAVTDPGLEDLSEMETFTCTKCGGVFRTLARLHVHIVNCSPIDPVYGSTKVDKSPSKIPFAKKLQRKFHSLIGKEQMSKARAIVKKNGMLLGETRSQKRVFTGCRKRTSVLLPDSPIKASMIPVHLSDLKNGYNPHRHIRRRELTELVDTLTCEACGLKFKTIILLERHVKNCTKKEKFKNVHPLACPILDESLARIKNICFYCEKNFTYTKSLINHFQDFCPVKKTRFDKGELTENDKLKEEQVIERLKKLEEDKLIRDPDHVKKKITWQVGRKPKRKGHSWTYIKKRKLKEDEDVADKLDEDTSDKLSDLDDDSLEKPISDLEEDEENDDEDVTTEQTGPDFDEVDSAPQVSKCETQREVDNTDNVEQQDIQEKVESVEIRKENRTNIDLLMKQEELRETHLNDMSFDCTSRYQVNKITAPKTRKTTDTVSKPSVIFQCISKEAENSDRKIKTDHSHSVSQNKTEEPSSLIIRSKRKRERVSKVEEFLRNAFRRKRRNKTTKSEDSEESLNQENNEKTRENQSHELVSEDSVQEQLKSDLPAPVPRESSIEEDSDKNRTVSGTDKHDSIPLEANTESSLTSNVETTATVQPNKDQARKRGRPRKFPLNVNPVPIPPVETYKRTAPGRPPGRPQYHSYVGKRGRPPKYMYKGIHFENYRNQKYTSSLQNEDPDTLNNETNSFLDKKFVDNKIDYDNQRTISNDFRNDEDNLRNQQTSEIIMNSFHYKTVNTSENEKEVKRETTDESDQSCQCFDDSSNGSCVDSKCETSGQPQLPSVEQSKQEPETEGHQGMVEIYDKSKVKPTNLEKAPDVELITKSCSKKDEMAPENVSELKTSDTSSVVELHVTREKPLQKDLAPKSLETPIKEVSVESAIEDEVSIENTIKDDVSVKSAIDLKIAETSASDNDSDKNECENDTVEKQVAEEKPTAEDSDSSGGKESIKTQVMDKKSVTDSVNHDIDETKSDSDLEKVSKQRVKAKSPAKEVNIGISNKCSTSIEPVDSETNTSVNSDLDDNADSSSKVSTQSEVELKANKKHETSLPKSPEPVKEFTQQPMLSPSERVKMNKRSCMKDRDPFTPVWVRKPSKPKQKLVESDKSSKSSSNTSATQDKTEASSVKSCDRNYSEPIVQTKKPLFKKRREAINENLKLLDKKVNAGYSENSVTKTVKARSVERMVDNAVNKEPVVNASPARGVKRKQTDVDITDKTDNIPVKRKTDSGRGGRKLDSDKINSIHSLSSKVEAKRKESASDKKAQKVKSDKM